MSKAQGDPRRPSEQQPDAYRPVGQFPREQRVRKRSDFRRIQAEGQRVLTPHLVVLLNAQVEADTAPRLGVTASRKIGNAVTRNRAKRVIRSAFRATRTLWARGIDVVIIVRRYDPEMDTRTVVSELLAVRSQIQRRTRLALQSC